MSLGFAVGFPGVNVHSFGVNSVMFFFQKTSAENLSRIPFSTVSRESTKTSLVHTELGWVLFFGTRFPLVEHTAQACNLSRKLVRSIEWHCGSTAESCCALDISRSYVSRLARKPRFSSQWRCKFRYEDDVILGKNFRRPTNNKLYFWRSLFALTTTFPVNSAEGQEVASVFKLLQLCPRVVSFVYVNFKQRRNNLWR